jgi:uncharacterized protein (DUF1800 family)
MTITHAPASFLLACALLAIPATAQPLALPESIRVRVDPLRPLRAIPITVDAPADAPRVFDVVTDNPAAAGVEPVAIILPGHTLGWAWVRPVGPGQATIRVADHALRVHVDPLYTPEPPRTPDRPGLSLRPSILAPVSGAAATGIIRISVNAPISPWLDTTPAPVSLTLAPSNGGPITLTPIQPPARAPRLPTLHTFELDTSALAPGPYTLIASSPDAPPSDPITLVVPRIDESATLIGECETDYGVLLDNQVGPPKPVVSQPDPAASGGRFFAQNSGNEPRFRFPASIPSPGYYQLILTASGSPVAGILPALGLTIDEAQRPATTGQIAAPDWHRVPIGIPVLLPAGDRLVRIDFLNDFAARGLDRNVRLDRIELVRVADAAAPVASADSVGQDQAAMTPMAMSDAGAMTDAPPANSPQAAGWPAAAGAAFRPPLRLAIASPRGWDQPGPLRAVVTTQEPDARRPTPPPRTDLLIGNQVVASQFSHAPRFALPAARPSNAAPDQPGRLIATLRTTAPGGYSITSEPLLIAPAHAPLAARSLRLTAFDPAWSGLADTGWRNNLGGSERWSAPVPPGAQVRLTLPEDLAGDFDVILEARSVSGQRPIEVSLEHSDHDPIRFTLPTFTDEHRLTPAAAPLRMSAGPKTLVLTDADPRLRAARPPRNPQPAVFVQSLTLLPREADAAAVATLVHPAIDEPIADADAAVLEFDLPAADAPRTVQAFLDAQPLGPALDVRRQSAGAGHGVVVPLLLSGVEPGPRRLSLRITTLAGRTLDVPERTVRVLPARPEGGTQYARAVALLDRLAFGPEPRELARVLRLGEAAYVRAALAERPDPAAPLLARQRFPASRSTYDVPRRAVHEAMVSATPVQARFTLFAQNHFSTWIRKAEAQRKSDEHDRFSRLGATDLHTLLLTSATGPAMLRYLDQERSYAGRINENYAREIMELHTLGARAGYAQSDVTNLAHVLAGWTTQRLAPSSPAIASPDEDGMAETFVFEPRLASTLDQPLVVLGAEFGAMPPEHRVRRVLLALELLVAHPASPRFIATALVEHYASAPADPALVEHVASALSAGDMDLASGIIALTEHPAFWAAALKRDRVAQPADFALRLARTTGWDGSRQIGDYLASSGRGMFDRATPDGFPEADAEAMNSSAMLQRWRLASQAESALADAVPSPIRYADRPIDDAEARVIIDLIAQRLTGSTLSPASRDAALAVLAATEPPRPDRPGDFNRDPRIRTLAAFIAQLPEANLR